MVGRERQRDAIAGGEQIVLVRPAAVPHRADGVDDVLSLEPKARRDFRRAGVATAKPAALLQQLRPGGAMDGAVDAAAAEQRAVRRVDDGVDVERRDVGHADFEQRRADRRGEKGLRGVGHVTSVRRAYISSARLSAARSTVLRLPILSKCSSRNRCRAPRPPSRSISKNS
jgi:hypothetical protein